MADETVNLNSDTQNDTTKDQGPLGESLTDHLQKSVEGYKSNPDVENPQSVIEDEEHKDETPEQKAEREAKEKEEKEREEAEKREQEETEETPEEKAAREKAEADANKEPEPGKPVPYDRFAEVLEAKNSFKRQLEESQTEVTNYRNITGFCENNNITVEQFNKALEVQALLNTNPQEALKRLLPIVEQLQGYTGDKLPDDLQKRVDLGKLDLEDARELAKARAALNHEKAVQKLTAEQQARKQQQEFQSACAKEAASWERAKRTADPDYAPKKSENAPDGKWEEVRDKYLALLNQTDARGQYVNPTNSPAEMIALMEKAYNAVNSRFSARNGAHAKAKTGKRLQSTGAPDVQTGRIEDAKSMKEAISLAMAQRAR